MAKLTAITVKNTSQLSQIVREHRKLSKLSREELAKLAGVGKTAIFDIEHGKESARWNTVLKILRALNITVSFSSPLMRVDE